MPPSDQARSGFASWAKGAVRFLWRPVLILAIAGGLAWWILGLELPRHPVTVPPPATPTTGPPAPERRWAPRETKAPPPGCAPRAERQCIQGDAWWLDSCGNAYTRDEICGRRRCIDGACEPEPTPDCGGIPVLGRCDDATAETCVGGHPVRIDCGASDRRCVMTEDGPACRTPTDEDCDPSFGPPRCDDTDLVACVEGRQQRVDCRWFGGTCGARPEGGLGCVVTQPSVATADCGVCGCPPASGEELCDGRDNDEDGYVDEDDNCGVVPIEVFVVSDDRGNSSFSDEEIRLEIDRVNAVFARDDDLSLTFAIAGIHALARPEWRNLDGTELDAIIAEGAVHPARDEFYVPLLLTDEIVIDEVPRPGASTVPNGTCGEMRVTPDPQSPIGVVAIGKRRWATTVAHELGHYFGLCHTHGTSPGAPQPVEPAATEREAACVEPCARTGDGICDTPEDPGPAACLVDAGCAAACGGGETPDPTNVMAYYPQCREGFSAEQAKVMRHTLYLRRQWHACIWGEGCDCDPRAPACPEAMTCRNATGDGGEMVWRCGMAGAVVPRGPCRNNLDCKDDAICIKAGDGESLCVRPCGVATPDCDCRDIEGFDVPLCMADFDGL